MSVADFSFSALSRDAATFTWPSMVVATGIYGLWSRRRRRVRPSRRTLAVSWLAAAGGTAINDTRRLGSRCRRASRRGG